MTRLSFLMSLAALGLAVAAPANCAPAPIPPDTPAGPDFLTRNAVAKGVVTTPSGLQYFVVTSGASSGAHPKATDTVTLDYELKLLSGETVDSSYANGESFTGKVSDFVPGFSEALELMRPGDEWIIWIPPQLGYGAKNVGPIPPNSVLSFRLALHSIASGG